MELVSIIVPIYNSEKYLKDCLDSLVNQSYQNIEIILVDDGSTDNTKKICELYEKKYNNIRYIYQKNRGAGYARNMGLEEIRGSYFTFVDSDDYVAKSFITSMINLMKDDITLVECGNVYMLETRNIFKNCDKKELYFYDNQEILNNQYRLRNTVWGRLYNTKKYKSIRFSDKRLGEDAEYSSKVLEITNNMVLYGHCLYSYRSYSESITRLKLTNKVIKKLKRLYDYEEFKKSLLEYLLVIEHRKEEAIYVNKLKRIRKIINSKCFETADLIKKVDELIDKGNVSTIKKIVLNIKHIFIELILNYKVKTNYKYKLE